MQDCWQLTHDGSIMTYIPPCKLSEQSPHHCLPNSGRRLVITQVAAAAASVGGGFAAMKGSLGSWGTYLKGQADKVGETVAARAGSSPLAAGRPASSRSPSTTSQRSAFFACSTCICKVDARTSLSDKYCLTLDVCAFHLSVCSEQTYPGYLSHRKQYWPM